MKKDIAGVVVLYYPDEKELLRNIHSYLPFVDKLYVIDNTDQLALTGIEKTVTGLQNAEYTVNKINEGIAAALNRAARQAQENGYSWLLTMDQDSSFSGPGATDYFSQFENEFSPKNEIAVVAPSHFPGKTGVPRENWSERTAVMTSGNLIRLSAWKDINGFDEKLFIDEVDHEYCYRLKIKGYKIIQLNHIFLTHQLGEQKESGYFGHIAKRSRRLHSPRRVYFIVRNYLYVRKKYKKYFPDEFRQRDRSLLVTLKNNLFFSGKLLANLKSIRKAFRDYKKGIFPSII